MFGEGLGTVYQMKKTKTISSKQAVKKSSTMESRKTSLNQAKPRTATRNQTQKNRLKPQKGIKTNSTSNQLVTSKKEFSGIVDDIGKAVDLGLSLADTVVTTIENPIDGLLNKVPNTIAKFADMANNVSVPLVPGAKDSQIKITGPILAESKEEKFISALKQDIPVVQTTLMPSAYSADYAPAPLVIKDAHYGNTPCVRVNGSIIVRQISASDCSGVLERHTAGFLNPATQNFGNILKTMANQYQKHLWLNVSMFYISNCGTQITGNVILTFQNSPNISYTPTTDIKELSQRSQFIQGHINKGLTLPLKGDHKQLYNFFSGTSSDMKFYSDWSFELWLLGCCSTDGVLGYLGMTFDVLLFSRIENPLIGLNVFSVRSIEFLRAYCGYSTETCFDLLEKIMYHFEPEELQETYCTNVSNKLAPFNASIRSGRFNLEGCDQLILKELGWSDLRKNHPVRYFVAALCHLFEIRNYDLTLLSRYQYEFNFISTFIEYILENYEKDYDLPPENVLDFKL